MKGNGDDIMNINVNKQGTVCEIRVAGRLDTTTAPELETVIQREASGMTELHLQFDQLEYLSSAGLRVILGAHKRMISQGGELVIHNVNDVIMEIFEITGFQDILTIKND